MNPFDSRPGLFDVAWRMFGISVRIKPSYWIFVALFAVAIGRVKSWQAILAWVLAAFICNMFEKLCQAIVGRCFGFPATIILVAMGGGVVAEYARAPRWQRIVIYAGSLLGTVLLVALLCLVGPSVVARLNNFGGWMEFVFNLLAFLLFFAVLGLVLDVLPVLPNAAGQIVTELLGYAVGKRDFFWGTIVSIVVAGAVAGYSAYKYFNPDAPYLMAIAQKFVPGPMTFLIMGDSTAWLIGLLFGLSLIYNVANLFFKKR